MCCCNEAYWERFVESSSGRKVVLLVDSPESFVVLILDVLVVNVSFLLMFPDWQVVEVACGVEVAIVTG